MKKKKELTPEQKHEKKRQKLSSDYYKVLEEYPVIAGKEPDEQVKEMVIAACAIQKEICECADYIRIEKLEEAADITQIDKSTWLDFVRIASLKDVGKLQEKAIHKFENDFEKRLLITNLRKTFLESYMSGKEMQITDEDNYNYTPFDAYKSEDFLSLLEDSAKKRVYINTILRPLYKELSNAAQYVTDLKLKPGDFKNLVDWEYYKDGGYPSPTSPSKIWAIVKTYDHAIRLMQEYGFEAEINKLQKEFGLTTELHKPCPVEHPWMIDNEDDE